MSLTAIRFRRTKPGPGGEDQPTANLEIIACELDDSSAVALERSVSRVERPAVFVVALPVIRKYQRGEKNHQGDEVLDRLTKIAVFLGRLENGLTPSTFLARSGRGRSLLDRLGKRPAPWVVVLDTSYVTGGQLARGMGIFLGRLDDVVLRNRLPAGWLDCVYILRMKPGRFSVIRDAAKAGKPLGDRSRRVDIGGKIPKVIEVAMPGSSEAAARVRQRAARAAGTNAPVLLRGEPGGGKGHLARGIHEAGRASRPFKKIDCELHDTAEDADRELFGEGGGAAARPGLWESAADGSLYLAHVEALPLRTQRRLRNAMADGRFPRGAGGRGTTGEPSVAVDGELGLGAGAAAREDVIPRARVIASTTANLGALVASGRFDETLLFRLAGFPIDLPPLRERRRDIVEIAPILWKKLFAGTARRLPTELLDRLAQRTWPGNLREMRACLSRLRNLVGERPTVADFDALCAEEARAGTRPRGTRGADAGGRLGEAEFFARLAEAGRTIDVGLRVLFREPVAELDEVALQAEARLAELAELMQTPTRFRDVGLWERGEALEDALQRLHDQATAGGAAEARALWKAEIAPAARRLVKAAIQAVRR